jgi:hypothetical protein
MDQEFQSTDKMKARGSRGVDLKSTVILHGLALLLIDVLVAAESILSHNATSSSLRFA